MSTNRRTREQQVARRHLGHRGEVIAVHRALHTLRRDPLRQASALVIALVLTVAWMSALPWIARLWAMIAQFVLDALGGHGSVILVTQAHWGPFEIVGPRISLYAGLPSPWDWSVGLGVTAVMLFVSLLLPGRFLPLTYALRLLALLQISSQIVFALAPHGFPYEVGGYTEVLFIANLFLLGLAPLVLALTFSPLDFHLRYQVALPLIVMGHLTIFVPLQFTAHALLLNAGSLLWMPLLFWAFGLTLDVAVIVALYGWAVSWNARPYRPQTSSHPRRREIGFAVLVVAGLLAGGAERAHAQTYRWSATAGVEFGHYTNGLGDSDAQLVSLTHDRPWLDRWRVDLGRAARFGDEGLGIAVGYARHLQRETVVSVGLSTGTGDVIFPEWRFDAGVRRTGLHGGRLIADLGYTHVQSKAVNSSDGVGAGLLWNLHGPWSIGVDGRVDVGHPGSDVAHNLGASVLYGLYRKLYLSVRGEVGRVAYTLVGPTDALVEYDSRGLRAGVTWYVRVDRGVALEASYSDTDFYELRSITLRAFREW